MIRSLDPVPQTDTSIDALIARHGALKVLAAALRALLRPPQLRPPPLRAQDLDPHLRRDLGLPPERADPLKTLPPIRPIL
ncbi:hypothetical protein [Litorisediminicola beolgyonensis]|uniref:DUF1127 domain-containing protein n=1 Tax=Litorisediminicola beolgyonensis TaxID=1173614 RepID=A0ABW3ZEB9_9RHOB